MDYYQTLVIILSITLAVFLVLAIICTILAIIVFTKLKRIAGNAEQVSDNIVEASKTIKQFAGPAAIANLIMKVIKR
jgi:preprotein translocase subunit SecY